MNTPQKDRTKRNFSMMYIITLGQTMDFSLLACQFLASNMWSTTYFPISCRGLVTKIALLQYSIEDMLLKLKNLNTPYEDMY